MTQFQTILRFDAIKIFAQINEWIYSLPPYDKSLFKPMPDLEYFLNNYQELFECTDKTKTYDYSEYHLTKFIPSKTENCAAYIRELLLEFEKEVRKLFDTYITFLESYEAVFEIFKPFIDKHLHRKETFLSPNELADEFDKFNRSVRTNFETVTCSMKSFGYSVITDSKGESILCEDIIFSDLKSFLFYDFFRGISENYIPNQCKQCGKYFLIEGRYFRFCENPVDGEPGKTCRDIGSRRRYDDKCKNDPIWQTYNRAYKAHYARYMKKKMTVSEFEKWSRFASEIRDKAISNQIPYDEYYEEIRK